MKTINAIDKALTKIEELLVMILLCLMVAVVSLQVLNQTVLHMDIMWTEEVSRIFLVWVTLVGASMAIRKGQHLSVDFVYDNLKGVPKYICRVIVLLVSLFTTLYVGRSGIFMVIDQANRGNFFGITQLPTWVASGAVPVCFLLMSLRYIMLLVGEAIEFFGRAKTEEGGEK